jgi:hypothetical protein
LLHRNREEEEASTESREFADKKALGLNELGERQEPLRTSVESY